MREQIWADGQFKAWGPPASAPMQKRPRGPTELRLKQLSQGTSRSLEGVQSSGTHGLVHPGARSPVAGVQVGGTQPLPSPDRSAPWSSHSFFPPLNPPTPTVHGWPLLMGQPPSGVLPPRTTPQICMPPPSASPLVLLPPSPSRGGAPRALAPTGLPAHHQLHLMRVVSHLCVWSSGTASVTREAPTAGRPGDSALCCCTDRHPATTIPPGPMHSRN